jgi:hypothetical protein
MRHHAVASPVFSVASDSTWQEKNERLGWQQAVVTDPDLSDGSKVFAWDLVTHCMGTTRWYGTPVELAAEVHKKRSVAYVHAAELEKRGFVEIGDGWIRIIPLSLRPDFRTANPDFRTPRAMPMGIARAIQRTMKRELAAAKVPTRCATPAPAVDPFHETQMPEEWVPPEPEPVAPEPEREPEPPAKVAEAVAGLVQIDIGETIARAEVNRYSAEVVLTVLFLLAQIRSRGTIVRNPPGLALAMLRDQSQYPQIARLLARRRMAAPRVSMWDGPVITATEYLAQLDHAPNQPAESPPHRSG